MRNPFESHSFGYEVWEDAQRPLLAEIVELRAKLALAESECWEYHAKLAEAERTGNLALDHWAKETMKASSRAEQAEALNEANYAEYAALREVERAARDAFQFEQPLYVYDPKTTVTNRPRLKRALAALDTLRNKKDT